MSITPGKFTGARIQPVGAGNMLAQRPNPASNSKKSTTLLGELERTKLEGDPLYLYGSGERFLSGNVPELPPIESTGDRLIFFDATQSGNTSIVDTIKVAIGVDADYTMWFQSTGSGVGSDGEEAGFDWYCPGASTSTMNRRMRLTPGGNFILGTIDPQDEPFGSTSFATIDGDLWVDGPIRVNTLTIVAAATPIPITRSTSYVDATALATTMELPLPEDGYEFTIKRLNAGANAVVVDGLAANIDGAATKSLNSQYACIVVRADGTDWHVISTFGTVV